LKLCPLCKQDYTGASGCSESDHKFIEFSDHYAFYLEKHNVYIYTDKIILYYPKYAETNPGKSFVFNFSIKIPQSIQEFKNIVEKLLLLK
jgi:hypothetical protein